MDADLAFCLECFADEQIDDHLRQTEEEIVELQVEENDVLKRLDRNDTKTQAEIDTFAENVRENEKTMTKNRQMIEEELRKILQSMSTNLDRMSAMSVGQQEDAELRSFSNRLRHQFDQLDSEMTQLNDTIDQRTSSNYHQRLTTWIGEHLEYMKESTKIPKESLMRYAGDRLHLWNERAMLIDGVTGRLSLEDLSVRRQLNADLHHRSRNVFHLIQHLRSFIGQLRAKEKADDERMLNDIQTTIEGKRGEHQTRAVELVDALRQLAWGSKNANQFQQKFDEVIRQTSDFVPIIFGHIDHPKEKDLQLTMRLDGDFQTWSENSSSIREKFCLDLCQGLDLPPKSIRILAVQEGSAILHAFVQAPYGKQVLDILSIDLHDRKSSAADIKYLNRMKEIAIKYKSPLTSIKVGEFGVKVNDQLMDARWNKLYTKEPGHANAAYWTGALNRGGKPYFCPEGWMRFGIKVAKNDQVFDAQWGTWHIAYHGTRGANAPLILTSGLRSSVKGCFAIRNRSSVYLTPSIEYAAHPRYARPWEQKRDGQTRWYQLVFQCRVNPQSVGQPHKETLLGKEKKHLVIDQNFANEELEWIIPSDRANVTYIRDNIVCYGMMIRICDCDPKELRSSSWWKHTAVGEAKYDSF